MNLYYKAFPDPGQAGAPPLEPGTFTASAWPPVPGEYFVPGGNRTCHVAVSTLASVSLAEELSRLAPAGLCIVGKTETENIGIEKVIKNSITNPAIHYLIVAGRDPEGHRSGETLLSLCRNGMDKEARVIGSTGKRPVLKNVAPEEVEAFRRQLSVIDMIGCENATDIARRMGSLSAAAHLACSGREFTRIVKPVAISGVETVRARVAKDTKLDRAGYFVILPLKDKACLRVEHYANDNRLLRVIDGEDAVSIYKTIIENGWVTQLSHAAYLGKELDRAELSMKLGFKYIQDGI